jgi:opacity protein-like surface antigen
MKPGLAASCLTAIFSTVLPAQEWPKLTFELAAGLTESVGTTRTNLEQTGWNLGAGAGFQLGHGLGVMLNLGLDYLAINSPTLNTLGVPNGNIDLFTALVNPVYHLPTIHGANFYVIAGGGYFRQSDNFSAPIASRPFSNSFFGFYSPSGLAPPLIAGYSVNKPGYDVGGGIEYAKWHGKIFAEARYEHMFNGQSHTDLIPVRFGFRW